MEEAGGGRLEQGRATGILGKGQRDECTKGTGVLDMLKKLQGVPGRQNEQARESSPISGVQSNCPRMLYVTSQQGGAEGPI